MRGPNSKLQFAERCNRSPISMWMQIIRWLMNQIQSTATRWLARDVQFHQNELSNRAGSYQVWKTNLPWGWGNEESVKITWRAAWKRTSRFSRNSLDNENRRSTRSNIVWNEYIVWYETAEEETTENKVKKHCWILWEFVVSDSTTDMTRSADISIIVMKCWLRTTWCASAHWLLRGVTSHIHHWGALQSKIRTSSTRRSDSSDIPFEAFYWKVFQKRRELEDSAPTS